MIYLKVFDAEGLTVAEWEAESPTDYPDEEWLRKAFAEAAEGESAAEG